LRRAIGNSLNVFMARGRRSRTARISSLRVSPMQLPIRCSICSTRSASRRRANTHRGSYSTRRSPSSQRTAAGRAPQSLSSVAPVNSVFRRFCDQRFTCFTCYRSNSSSAATSARMAPLSVGSYSGAHSGECGAGTGVPVLRDCSSFAGLTAPICSSAAGTPAAP